MSEYEKKEEPNLHATRGLGLYYKIKNVNVIQTETNPSEGNSKCIYLISMAVFHSHNLFISNTVFRIYWWKWNGLVCCDFLSVGFFLFFLFHSLRADIMHHLQASVVMHQFLLKCRLFLFLLCSQRSQSLSRKKKPKVKKNPTNWNITQNSTIMKYPFECEILGINVSSIEEIIWFCLEKTDPIRKM